MSLVRRGIIPGVVAASLGLMLLALQSIGGGGVVFAGNVTCVIDTPTPAATATVVITSLQELPTCTPTSVVIVRTATPTAPATAAATATPVPPTAAPATEVPTQAPPTATNTPLGGGVGAGVSGPNTGTGDGTAGGSGMRWTAALAVALIVLGGGAIAYGAKRRG